MNQKQMDAAKEEMILWLSHPQELGKTPSKIELGGEFDLYDMHYYIFKYKKNAFGKWLLGVCGGYEGDALTHCGHVFSEMQEYVEESAKEDAIALVEMVRSYWTEQAEKADKEKENAGTFLNFVLLEKPVWNKNEFLKKLKDDWDIEDEEDDEDTEEDEEDYITVLNYRGSLISVGLMPGPIPDGEAEYHAQSNYLWKEAEEVVKTHQAHLVVMVKGEKDAAVEMGELFVKVMVTLCRQGGVIGIYANSTVYHPEFYMHFAEMLEEGLFPIFNLVWFGLYRGKNGVCGYTCGMRNFGYDEIEIIDSSADSQEVGEFLSDIANYVITENVILQDGETIGFTEEQKLPITKSMGVAVEGQTLKIGF